jgi:molecular chaperone GrpE
MKKEAEELVEEVVSEPQAATPDYQELYLRSVAEQENLRKRLEQDKRQFTQFALSGAVESLLPVVDNFYRATEHVPEDQKTSGWITGILHIQKQLTDILGDWGVTEIPVKPGDAFSDSLHEAIGTTETTEVPEDAVAQVNQRGYKLHDKVIRPARVTTNTKS